MAEGKAKFLEDAARVIDGRVAALKAELAEEEKRDRPPSYLASDRAAILEAEYCAALIRTLLVRPYRSGDLYATARRRWSRGERPDHG